MKWNDLSKNNKLYFFIITFIIGFFIRMMDPSSLIMCLYYILLSFYVYKKDERKNALGLQKTTWKAEYLSLLSPLIFIAIFFPFYVLSPLCPIHLFDALLKMAYDLVGNVFLMIIIFYILIGTFSVFAEEIYFRGFLQDAMDDLLDIRNYDRPKHFSFKRFLSLLIVSFLFGISHLNLLWASLFEWFSIPPDFLFIIIGIISLAGVGLLFGFLRIKFNSLYPAIISHAISNFFMIFIPSMIIWLNGGFS
ncbi:MAG: CPBP family intramembrane metalloprotease [Candidatus Lokiarchaeota archaeon]|nr:CPBP family intramembrane metalloprotease [Candidatus Lokiarchaeota archaeon]